MKINKTNVLMLHTFRLSVPNSFTIIHNDVTISSPPTPGGPKSKSEMDIIVIIKF